MVYGLNYQGSKNKIAGWVLEHLPPAQTFVDVFGGGGAITHAAMLSGKYRNFVFNDLNPLCQCFARAARGENGGTKKTISPSGFAKSPPTKSASNFMQMFLSVKTK